MPERINDFKTMADAMKNIIGLMLVAAFALVGCEKPDEKKETAQQVNRAYENAAKAKHQSAGDAAAGKAIAEKCARCHGMDGVLADMGAPFISGLNQDYLVSAMLAYADGSRINHQMNLLVSDLKQKPEQIADVSAYYAGLKTSWKGASPDNGNTPSVSLSPDAVKAGAAVASRCNDCHGANRITSKNELIPVLAAMTPEYFIPSLKSYFDGKRKHGVMKIFGSLKESEIRQLAAYYAMQPPLNRPRSGKGKGNAKAGERAAGACAGCHSIDGNSLNPKTPSLAGQPAEYLIKAMKDYRDGSRNDPLMSDAVRKMPDETIADLAAHYAAQKAESPLQRTMQDATHFSPLAEGQKISGSCGGCHGKSGNSVKAGTPSLTGLHVKYLASATKEYRDGTRKNDAMKKMVGHLSDTDIEKVSFYYATQLPASGKPLPKADLAAGEKISAGCTSCHGQGGISNNPATPSLAGQDAGYLAAATRDYARGARGNEAMAGPAKGLKPDEILNVAAYFASLKAVKPETILPVPPQLSIVQKCSRCHGENGRSTERGIPALAGQSEAYLVLALKEYQDGTRKQHMMHAMSDVLSLVEIKAIAAFYARQ